MSTREITRYCNYCGCELTDKRDPKDHMGRHNDVYYCGECGLYSFFPKRY